MDPPAPDMPNRDTPGRHAAGRVPAETLDRQHGAGAGAGLSRGALTAIAAVQAAAALVFLIFAAGDVIGGRVTALSVLEAVLIAGLALGTILVLAEVYRADRRLQRQGRALAVASGALARVIDAQFSAWGLTQAEREVAMLALKGLDNAEIARIRGAAPGTVRAQMTHIYHKAGVSGRAQFAAWFVEDLLQDGLPVAEAHDDPA